MDNLFKNFVCPIDGLPLAYDAKSLRCAKDHVYDLAREGYCNLLMVGQKASLDPGDNKEMVAARRRFLEAGYFLPIAKRVSEIVQSICPSCVVDAGCGEGYYLYQLRKSLPHLHLTGCDISKWAIKAAAKRSKDIAWAVAGNKHLPFAAGSVDLILCMFGFPDWKNFSTLQPDGGRILLVDPGTKHLAELKKIIYPKVKADKPLLSATKAAGYILEKEDTLEFKVDIKDRSYIQDLLAMTPHAYRITEEGRAKLKAVETLTVSIDVKVRVFKKAH